MSAIVSAPGIRFEGAVRNLSSEGLGIVNAPDGLVFFVNGAWPGDEGLFEVETRGPRYGYARLVELRRPSPERREPPCPHQGTEAGRCGGCPWMIAEYPAQARAKEHRVRHAFERMRLDPETSGFRPIWAAPSELGYRNRAQFKSDGERLGFVSEGRHEIADIEDCYVLTAPLRDRFRALRGRLPNPAWRPTIDARKWVFLELDDAMADDDEPELNRRRPFRQGNTSQNERMRAWVAARLAAARPASLLELYCGSGNFTELAVSAGVPEILGVEVAAPALRALEARAWPGVRTLARDLSEAWHFTRLAGEVGRPDVLLLDPPRAGAKGIERLVSRSDSLREILYVSCDVATWSRDVSMLAKEGWEPVEVQPLDLFPQTFHVEVLSRLERRATPPT